MSLFSKSKLFVVTVLFSGITLFAETDLHRAARVNSANSIRFTLRSGAVDINELNEQGQTALDVAVLCGSSKAARTLVKRGGKVTSFAQAEALRKIYSSRALKYFVAGFFIMWPLWIGTITSLMSKPSYSIVL